MDMTNVPIQVCINRDTQRAKPVGEKVIRRWYKQFIFKEFVARPYDDEKEDCIICDLDGNLCWFGDNDPYERDWSLDTCNPYVKSILEKYDESGNTRLILTSGRHEHSREATKLWLRANNIQWDELYMREEADNRGDDIIKEEIYYKYIEPRYNVRFVLDDRLRVCRMWKRLGLFTFCTNQGIEEF